MSLIAAVLLGLGVYGVAGIFAGPALIDRWIARHLASAPQLSATRMAIRFDPFTLTTEVTAFEIRNAETGAAFVAELLSVDFAARSLIERRAIVSSIIVEGPRAEVRSLVDLTTAGRAARDSMLGQARIEQLVLRDGELMLGADPARAVALSGIDLTLSGLDARSGDTSRFSFAAATATEASVAIDGAIAASLEQADGELRLQAVDIGSLAARLGNEIAAAEPRGRVDVSGAFSARGLLGEPTLQLNNARLLFTDLVLTPATDLTVTLARASAAADLQLTAGSERVDLSGRLEADDTQLVIADAHVMPPQTFAFEDAALLADADAADDGLSIIFSGRLPQAGETTLNVHVPPGAGTRRVSFDAANIPAALLSAYADDALGRRLAAGSADLGLDYGRSGNRAEGALRIRARDLAFAELPADERGRSLELASALLENADGIIALDLRFASNSGTVRDAVADALNARIATLTQTPFDTLATLLDSADRSANAVPFLPGDAALNDLALATVAALAQALAARPRLGLRVHGGFDPNVDRDALARQQIELHVQLATAGPGERARPAPVDFGSPRARDVLDEFAGERLPAERIAELAERFECAGALAEVCERAYYEQIFDALVANEEIEPRALTRLGRFRALSIVDALQQRGISPERLELVTGSDNGAVETPFGVGLAVEPTALAAPRG